jgi:hypothetical protein
MNIRWSLAQNVVLLADDVAARAGVVGTLLEEMEHPRFKVIQCTYVAECLDRLGALLVRPCLLLAHYYLVDGPLLPALRHWYDAQAPQPAPLPHLILWGREGLLGVVEHEGFLMEQRAVVFSFPLDLDAILGVARALVLPR